LYQQRVEARLLDTVALLKDPSVTFSFEADDHIALDRKDVNWLSSMTEADELWYRRTKLALLNLKMAGKTIEEARETVAKRYKTQLTRVRQEKSEDVFEVVLNSLTTLFDPHTNYWLPRTSKNFNINMSKSLEGIGAVLQLEDEFTKVVRLVTGGPAQKSGGLKAADRIVSVGQGEDGELIDIVGWRLDDVVDLIRGPRDTIVRLEVLPAGEIAGGDTTVISINRDKVKLEDQEAQKAILELNQDDKLYKLGVIQLPDFYIDFEAYYRRERDYKSSTRDVRRLLSELMKEGIDGLILDLRNNGGGSLVEATLLTDLFIDRGVVVQIKSPEGRISHQNRALQGAQYKGPLIVLVNRLSASASEIFAGAIQDYGRGLIVGSRSFGKGTVQNVSSVKLGQLKFTESKFYRVSGDSTQHRGVVPDIEFPSLIDEEEVGESAYDNALPWDKIQAAPHSNYQDYSSILVPLKKDHETRIVQDPDFVFLVDQIQLLKENQNRESVSLNEKKRLERKAHIEKLSMVLENKRRKAKGMEPYQTVEAFREAEENDEDDTQFGSNNKIDVDGDAFLIESGNIMIDMIELNAKDSQHQVATSARELGLKRSPITNH
jgi:carboxyl-terminal processing protease